MHAEPISAPYRPAGFRRWWLALLAVLVVLGAAGAGWALRDRWRPLPALYAEAQTADPARAVQLYAALDARAPELAEYTQLWAAQAAMPSLASTSALDQIVRYRPDSPAAYQALLTLARYYAQIESPQTVAIYRAALALDDTPEIGLELARYLEEQHATVAAYNQYLALLSAARPDAFADLRRTAPSTVTVAQDLLERHFYSDVLDVLRDATDCPSVCLRARALRGLGHADAAAAELACQACSPPVEGLGGGEAAPVVDEQQRLLASTDPVDWWRATWDQDAQAVAEGAEPASGLLTLYLRIAASDAYVADDAAYRALVLARRSGDAAAERQALALLERARPSWLAWRATGEEPLDAAPSYPDVALNEQIAGILAKVTALEALGRQDLALQELRFAGRVSERPEVIVAMAQALNQRGLSHEAFTLAVALLAQAPYAPESCWRLAYPQVYADEVARWAAEYGVEPALLWAVMRQESTYQPDVTSSAGAMGLMQLMPAIVADANAALGSDYAPGDAYRPAVGIRLAAWHLGALLDYYDGDNVLALMAYNAGMGNVDAWRQEATGQNLDDLLRFVPYGETREYVSRVSLNYVIYRTLYP